MITPVKAESSNLKADLNLGYIWLISVVAALGGLLFGWDWVVVGGAKPFFERYFHIADNAQLSGWANSCALIGCLIGALVAGALSDKFGRKKLLLLSAFLFAVTSLGNALAPTFAIFIAWRILGGVAIGLASNLSPMYIAEIAPAQMRGRLVSVNQLTIVIGILAAQYINWYLVRNLPAGATDEFIQSSWYGQSGWRWMFALTAAPSLLFFLGMFFVPESPRWLAKKGRPENAQAILKKIGGENYAAGAMKEISATLVNEIAKVDFRELLQPRLVKVLILGVGLAVFQQWCGINVIFNYAEEIFKAAGYDISSVLKNIAWTGSVNMAFTFVALGTVDRFGRRPLMLFGAAGLAVIYTALAICYHNHVQGLPMLLLVLAAIGCYAMSLAPVTWVVISEIFPNRIRGAAMSVAVSALWLACFLLTFTFPMLNAQLGAAGTFSLYAAICVAGFFFIRSTLPETKKQIAGTNRTRPSGLTIMKWKLFFLLASILVVTAKPLRAAETLPLAGEWRFALDRADAGINQNWFGKDLPDKIRLPGILQAQGYGDDISTDTPWVLTLGDAWWKIQPASLREHFSQPGHVEVPFLSQPPKHYLGAAWYQRDVEIPTDWSGKHFTLFLERAHWLSKVWVDDQEFPANDSLVAPHVTDLGVLTPGKHRLSIRVDNRTQLPAAGHLIDSHSISDGLGAAWNGIVGKIELRATTPVWIENLQVFPHVANKSITVKGKIGNLTGKSGTNELRFFISPFNFSEMPSLTAGTNVPFSWNTNGGSFETEISLRTNVLAWDEFNPTIYRLAVLPGPFDPTGVHFGLREITTSDKDILINGRFVNLRLTHDGGAFPLTGYPAMDVASWKKIIQTCKNYGLNGIRFHSWCPPEAAFEAADELGFYLQPECGLWADFGSQVMKQWLNDETARLLAVYGNHPSFILLSPSNEPKNYSHFTPQWAADNYAKDNRRLYSAGTGWADPSQVTGGAQFASLVRFGRGELRNATGWFGRDYRTALDDVHIPVLAHEVGQWCAYPDFDVMKKFTGYLQPGNYDIFKYIAEQNGVVDQNHDFAWASGRFQLQYYKEEIEANLRTPGLAGFQLLDLHDYLGQGTALIGVLDAFWESKGYVTPEEFGKFCGPVVPLARLNQRVFTTADKFEVPVEIYNFGSNTLTNIPINWEIVDANDLVVTNGWLGTTVPVGKNFPLGKISVDLSMLPAPAPYKLIVDGQNPPFANNWNFWLYPAQVEDSETSDVLLTNVWADAEKRLAAGGKVLFTPTAADLDPAKCPPMKNIPVFWNIQMTVRPPQNRSPRFDAMLGLLCDTNSPALAEFPTDKNYDWQWTQLINGVRSVNLTAAPRELKPIVWAIDDWNRNWKLGVIFECNVGKGKLLVSAINLNDERGGSELRQLRRSLLDYMGGAKFQPATTLTPEQARALWTRGAVATNEPARTFDPDLNDGSTPPPAKPKP